MPDSRYLYAGWFTYLSIDGNGAASEGLGQLDGAGLRLLHSQRQCTHAAQDEPGLVGIHGPTQVAMHLAQAREDFGLLGDDHAGHDVGMAVEMDAGTGRAAFAPGDEVPARVAVAVAGRSLGAKKRAEEAAAKEAAKEESESSNTATKE